MKIFNKNLDETVKTTDSLHIVATNNKGMVKAIRNVSDQHELAADFDKGKVEERYTVRQQVKTVDIKQQNEIRVVNRFLPEFNKTQQNNFQISSEQPITDSHIDVVIEDSEGKKVNLQVRVSDDEPWKDLHTKKFFERSGTGFTTYSNAIKKAITSKLKYPTSLRQQMMLLLDGWLAVRPEDLEYFRDNETEFLKETGYKEIWFVGGVAETIVRLYP